MTRTADAVVVGAGVVGCAVTYFLVRLGLRVILVDRAAVASGTSSASAGHASVQGRVPGPALDFAMANLELLDGLREELPGDFEYVRSGGVIVAEDETERALLQAFAARQSAFLPVRFLEPPELRELEPHLAPHFLGATYCPLDGYANPMGLALALAHGARERGATLWTGTEVTGVRHRQGALEGVDTTAERIATRVVVTAAGVWSAALAAPLGVELPLVPRRGQLVVTEPLPPLVGSIVSHAGHIPFREHGIPAPAEVEGELQKKRYLKQVRSGGFRGRFYVGSTSEFVGFDRATTWDGVSQLARYAVETVPALARARLVRTWAGLRPRTRDGRFLIGPVPGLDGVFLATGHDSVGVLHAPKTGQLLAEWIQSGRRPELLAPHDPARLWAAAEPVPRG
jgi:sarcosine oxidase subunit beta